MKIKSTIILFSLLCSCYLGEELPPDQEVWEYAHPESVGLNTDVLYETDDSLKRASFGDIHGLIIIKDDHLVFENYYDGGTRHDLKNIGSNTFTILILAMELFLEEALIGSLDDPIHPYLPEYEAIFASDTLKKAITFRHIISHKMGLSWDERGLVTNDFEQMKATDDWVGYILGKARDVPAPGVRFSLNSAGGLVIARAVQNRLGETRLEDFLKENLFDQIGIRDYDWERSPDETLNAANGLRLSALDMTRVAYMMIMEGRWLNKHRVITRDWVLDVSTEKTVLNTQYSFGYGWKVLTDDFNKLLQLDGASTYYADGGAGQSLFIIPEYQMIIAISAENFFANAETLSFGLFFNLLKSLHPAASN